MNKNFSAKNLGSGVKNLNLIGNNFFSLLSLDTTLGLDGFLLVLIILDSYLIRR